MDLSLPTDTHCLLQAPNSMSVLYNAGGQVSYVNVYTKKTHGVFFNSKMPPDTLLRAAFAPNGEPTVVAAYPGSGNPYYIQVLRMEPSKEISLYAPGLTAFAIDPSGAYIFGGFEDGSVCAWRDLFSEPCVFTRIDKAHAGLVTAVTISKDGRAAASGSHDGGVALWDMAAWLRAGQPPAERKGDNFEPAFVKADGFKMNDPISTVVFGGLNSLTACSQRFEFATRGFGLVDKLFGLVVMPARLVMCDATTAIISDESMRAFSFLDLTAKKLVPFAVQRLGQPRITAWTTNGAMLFLLNADGKLFVRPIPTTPALMATTEYVKDAIYA